MRYFVARGETDRLGPETRAHKRGAFAVLSDGATHFELGGPQDGPVLVFVPGLTIPLDFWDTITEILHARGFRTLTYSAYGRGYSDRVQGRYTPHLLVRQLDDLLRHLRLTDIHLVGSSMGALIALAYAGSPESRAVSLILSGPAGLSAERNLIAALPERGPLLPFLGKHLLRRNLLSHLAHNVQSAEDAERLRTLVLDGFRFEGSMYALTSTLKHFPLIEQDSLFDADAAGLPPSLLMWGAEDRVTPADGFKRAVELLKPRQAEYIPDCGHMASFERPQQFADLVTNFLKDYLR